MISYLEKSYLTVSDCVFLVIVTSPALESTEFRGNAILPADIQDRIVKPRAALMGLITAHERKWPMTNFAGKLPSTPPG